MRGRVTYQAMANWWPESTEVFAELKSEPGPGVILAHGGAAFDQSLAAADLVDEYRLIVYPFVVGSGMALFAGVTTPRHLDLRHAVTFPSGCAAMVYRRSTTTHPA